MIYIHPSGTATDQQDNAALRASCLVGIHTEYTQNLIQLHQPVAEISKPPVFGCNIESMPNSASVPRCRGRSDTSSGIMQDIHHSRPPARTSATNFFSTSAAEVLNRDVSISRANTIRAKCLLHNLGPAVTASSRSSKGVQYKHDDKLAYPSH